MPTGIENNRTNATLPPDVAQEILQKTKEESAIMRLARRIRLPGAGTTIPVISGDPTAGWVAETAKKPVSNPSVGTKLMSAYKMAVIETYSKEFTRDWKVLYDELVKTYDGLVAADTNIATQGGLLNGFGLSAQARGILLSAVDSTGRPLFVNSVAEGAIPRILGVPTYFNRGLYIEGEAATSDDAGDPAIVGVAGDWTKALYGTVEGINISINTQGVVTIAAGTSDETNVNLWQQNMVAIMAEVELGFRADTDCFNLLTGAIPTT